MSDNSLRHSQKFFAFLAILDFRQRNVRRAKIRNDLKERSRIFVGDKTQRKDSNTPKKYKQFSYLMHYSVYLDQSQDLL